MSAAGGTATWGARDWSGFFVFRTPLLPFDEILSFGEGLAAARERADPNPARLEAALERDRALLRERLRSAIERPVVREAIYVASPDLHAAMEAWSKEPDGEKGRSVELAIVRYYQRMAGRATPFGLFSGSSVGREGATSRLVVAEQAEHRRQTRLDMHYLCTLVANLERLDEIRAALRYRPNTGLYRIAGRIRYPETRLVGKQRSHHLVDVDTTDYLLATLERAEPGASREELARALAEADPEVSVEDAAAYVNEVVDAQILVSELAPAVTGPEPIHELIHTLSRAGSPAAETLARVRDGLQALDASGLGADPEAYRSVARQLEGLPAEVDPRWLFQVDLYKPAPAASLNQEVLDEILRGVCIVAARGAAHGADLMAGFREAFKQRYEARQVPLVEVLDEDFGIGFQGERGGLDAAPLLKGIVLPAGAQSSQTPWDVDHTRLLKHLLDAAATNAREIELAPHELEPPAGVTPRLPEAFAAIVTLAAPSAEALARGEFKVLLRWAFGPSGARLLGRFCHGEPQLLTLVERHLRAEEAARPDAIFAEIVHLPEGRLGNVLLRPLMRSHEIPFLARSGAPHERQIPITDLDVAVEGERVVLRSRRLGREIVPRMSNAHNFALAGAHLAIYQFLCSLQAQNVLPGVAWSWAPLDAAPFLPRVSSGRIVLCRARWRLDSQEIGRLRKGRGSEIFAAVQALRETRGLPRFVALVESDNELPVDLDNVLSVEALVDTLARSHEADLVEMFPGPDELCARGREGGFVHELIVPLHRRPEPAVALSTRAPAQGAESTPLETQQSFAPGSDWLYAKIYCGTGLADAVLAEVVGPLAARARGSGDCDRWFFLRYADPDPHLRLRFHGDPRRLTAEVLPLLHDLVEPLRRDGRVWKLQLDTYEREIERYGGPLGMDLSEQVFHADSEAVLALLQLTQGDDGTVRGWKIALLGVHRLLEDLGFDGRERGRLIRHARDGFSNEFRAKKDTRITLGRRFRQERANLEALLERPDVEEPEAAEILRQRSERLAGVRVALASLERRGHLALAGLALSYLHMHVNRLLRSQQRQQEFVLYDFLDRLYQSQDARGRPHVADGAQGSLVVSIGPATVE